MGVREQEPVHSSLSTQDTEEILNPRPTARKQDFKKLPRAPTCDGVSSWDAYYIRLASMPGKLNGPKTSSLRGSGYFSKVKRLCTIQGKCHDIGTKVLRLEEFCQLRQSAEENLDDWADRVYYRTMDAYEGMADAFIQEEATRRFCKGFWNKKCASFVGGRLAY